MNKTHLLQSSQRLAGVAKLERLQIDASVLLFQHDEQLIGCEFDGVIVVGATVIAVQLPLVDQVFRIATADASHAQQLHETGRRELAAVPQFAQFVGDNDLRQDLVEFFLLFAVHQQSALDWNNFQHDRVFGRRPEHKHFAEHALANLAQLGQCTGSTKFVFEYV